MRDIANAIRHSGKVSADELNNALDLFGETDELWKNLVSLGLIKEEEVFKALAEYSGLEYVDLTGVNIDANVLSLLPAAFCRKQKVLPIGARGDHLFLAISNPSDLITIDDTASMTDLLVAPKIVAPSILQQTIDRYLRSDDELASLATEIGSDADVEIAGDDISNDTDEAPIVRFVNLLISQAIQDRASDIHVEPGPKDLKVRFRIDGVLHEAQKADRSIQAGILSRLKIMADIDIAEKRKPQDGRMSVQHQGKTIDVRVASLPTVWGEKIIMRILDHSTEKRSLDSVGMSERNLKVFRSNIMKSNGLVLVTGPTGSGKALRLDTKLPTPTGWTTIGEVRVGDEVLDSRGLPTRVTTLSEVNTTPELYKVVLSDGQEIYADGDHQWIVASHASRNDARQPQTMERKARRARAHAAASALRSLAELYGPAEIITLEEMAELVNIAAATEYFPNKSVGGALKYMHAWMDPIITPEGKRFEVLAHQSFMLLADRLQLRYAGQDKDVLLTMTTDGMIEAGLKDKKRTNFSIPVVDPQDNGPANIDLPINPYALGAWLGAGNSDGGAIASGYDDYEEMAELLGASWRGPVKLRKTAGAVAIKLDRPEPKKCVRGHDQVKGKNYCTVHNAHYGKDLNPVNASLGVLLAHNKLRNNKHIPAAYLRASFQQRLALLQGLMDTGGTAHEDGHGMEMCFSNEVIASATLELVRSLGIKATTRKRHAGHKYADGLYVPRRDSYAIDFVTTLPVFRLKRKLNLVPVKVSEKQKWLYITAIEPVSSEDENYGPVRCITVDSPDSSYLCADLVVTHNSTTLYTTLDEVANVTVNVITVEDPVEKRIEGVNQVQINNKAGLTFPAALKSILRSDPDVVLIGEIRDGETATIAVEASLTGHLVLSTLHTNGAPDALPRLVEMGVEPYLVSTAVACVVAQRLARRLCDKCKEMAEPDSELLESLDFPKDEKGKYAPLPKAVGCTTCSNTGYRGRLAVLEVMTVSETIERMVVNHAAASELRAVAEQEGMVPLRQDGFRLVALGQTTIEEILRVC